MSLKRVSVIGSGNWGSTIAKIVGNNIRKFPEYVSEVRMWVFEEMIDGRKLTDIINTSHENVKYLPNIKLPENVIADPDVKSAARDADILVIVMPHQFLNRTLAEMKPVVKPTSCAISLMKGLALSDVHGIRLLTDCIRDVLNIPCAALMGANLATEVSQENYCEATIGVDDPKMGSELKKLFQTDYFRIVVIKDEVGTELCGALKNIVAVAAGIIEGLGFGDNTKAAVIRLGFMEMKNFIYEFFGDRHPQEGTFLESCGVADLITTCYGGRNKQMGIALATTNEPLAQLEKERLKGQSAQGPLTAAEVYAMLERKGLLEKYPLFTAVHKVCTRQFDPKNFICCLANHPEHR
ncbi:Glycerol-3-phosphate dehydrogenase [NAD(+)], cytoplasmic [Schistosoma japonicum]|uniref:Glycerol-3-phosphate dehydrogenase [NAD(+)] n=1 Tax=Schistosoma japonicum TaxID=6182 RepID=C1LMP2_SCHJA|nr:Glycerol-3-phosphate dehydrogenase [NAD(+)], cytoplasmic [Schistosoma japonicum]TNN20052.1 Glycerol-3-phosphate dehydrogenase [NAD(+)], cytoplasmic [Schistosoma japonicum]CAX75969.1 glycerol-3-phosphate dehydrogenase 1 [Schistosoma japonicum]CAX75970.1 glycerol-3-phosphate dehydrogenase 1 [Schistosoma japonicum]CAX75971.1 glycerol-3-phosphate dehydrogenase 1 [Schistosoma japonicum]